MTVEWVEVKGPSVDVAVEAAMAELGIESRDAVEVEVLQEAERGFLGIGRTDAVVRVKPRPQKKRRKRKPPAKRRSEGAPRENAQAGREKRERSKPERRAEPRRETAGERTTPPAKKRETIVSREEQAGVVGEFLEGLLEAFGLEGEVKTRVEDDIIHVDVVGSETEALVGSRGIILQSIHELAKTVVQRKSQESARIRLDIAGYGERRREALKIYAERLAAQVIEEGGEVMLEPMNAAERKIIHDTVGEMDGVRTYSEGEEPKRSVVIAAKSDDDAEE